MWYGQDVMWYTLLYEMIMFCKLSATGRSLMVVYLLYEMQMPCNCFSLSLCVSDSCRSNSWRDDHDATMEVKVSSRWQWRSWRCFGDGDQKHKMMMAISCHIFLISCDIYLICILFCLDRRGHIMSHILIACDVYLLCILFCLDRR